MASYNSGKSHWPARCKLMSRTFTSKPNAYAFTKSAPFCRAPISFVCFDVYSNSQRHRGLDGTRILALLHIFVVHSSSLAALKSLWADRRYLSNPSSGESSDVGVSVSVSSRTSISSCLRLQQGVEMQARMSFVVIVQDLCQSPTRHHSYLQDRKELVDSRVWEQRFLFHPSPHLHLRQAR